MKKQYKLLILLVVFIASINNAVSENKNSVVYVHTVDISVKILAIKNNTITYKYMGKEVKSKHSVQGYFDKDDTQILSLKKMKLNEEYTIQLEFPVSMRNKAMKNLKSGLITFIGIDVYPV